MKKKKKILQGKLSFATVTTVTTTQMSSEPMASAPFGKLQQWLTTVPMIKMIIVVIMTRVRAHGAVFMPLNCCHFFSLRGSFYCFSSSSFSLSALIVNSIISILLSALYCFSQVSATTATATSSVHHPSSSSRQTETKARKADAIQC